MSGSNPQEIVVFHSALGLRPALLRWAARLRAAGHVVHTPARGAILLHAPLPIRSLSSDAWPPTCPVQVHFAEGDPLRHQPVIDALAARVRKSGARFEEFRYAGAGHHFSDPDWPGYSEHASEQMFENVRAFLDSLVSSKGAMIGAVVKRG
jgi:dienelactone hydrolase